MGGCGARRTGGRDGGRDCGSATVTSHVVRPGTRQHHHCAAYPAPQGGGGAPPPPARRCCPPCGRAAARRAEEGGAAGGVGRSGSVCGECARSDVCARRGRPPASVGIRRRTGAGDRVGPAPRAEALVAPDRPAMAPARRAAVPVSAAAAAAACRWGRRQPRSAPVGSRGARSAVFDRSNRQARPLRPHFAGRRASGNPIGSSQGRRATSARIPEYAEYGALQFIKHRTEFCLLGVTKQTSQLHLQAEEGADLAPVPPSHAHTVLLSDPPIASPPMSESPAQRALLLCPPASSHRPPGRGPGPPAPLSSCRGRSISSAAIARPHTLTPFRTRSRVQVVTPHTAQLTCNNHDCQVAAR